MYSILPKHQLSAVLTRIFVVEFLLKSVIYTILHSVFFKAGIFYGVRLEGLQRNLEHISDELVANGEFLYFSYKF